MQKSFLPNFINDINGDHVWRFEKIQNFQLQRFVDNDRYLKSLNQQNSQILEELDRRTAKILEFGNRINEFEYQLNEREGNALRLLAEPELDYTPKREQIRELEAGIRQLESTYKPLPFEPLRNQINEIIEKTATVEAECIEREINLDFRKGKYNLNVLLTRPFCYANDNEIENFAKECKYENEPSGVLIPEDSFISIARKGLNEFYTESTNVRLNFFKSQFTIQKK